MHLLSSALGVCRRALPERWLRIGNGLHTLKDRLRSDVVGVIGNEFGGLAREILLSMLKPDEVVRDDFGELDSNPPWDRDEPWERPDPSFPLSGFRTDHDYRSLDPIPFRLADCVEILNLLSDLRGSRPPEEKLWNLILPQLGARMIPWIPIALSLILSKRARAELNRLIDRLRTAFHRLGPK